MYVLTVSELSELTRVQKSAWKIHTYTGIHVRTYSKQTERAYQNTEERLENGCLLDRRLRPHRLLIALHLG
jgi:hypothetical protein